MALSDLQNFLSVSNGLLLASAFVFYYATLVVYRLSFHPLSKIPGYKIAAATRLYEYHFDSTCNGMYWKKLQQMHEDHGPIVRINPYEVHINDPDFFHQLYSFDSVWDKDPLFTRSLGMTKNIESTIDWYSHKKRRAPFNNFFSRMKIAQLENTIRDYADKICDAMTEGKGEHGVISLSLLYRCFTAEIICQYCFARTYGFFDDLTRARRFLVELSRPGDFPGVHHLGRFSILIKAVITVQTIAYFIRYYLGLSPKSGFVHFFGYATDMINSALKDRPEPRSPEKTLDQGLSQPNDTVFRRLIESDLPAADKSFDALFENAVIFLFAGFETTGFSLTLGTYHVLLNSNLHNRLKVELRAIWPTATDPAPPWSTLEKSPLLHATILEALRMSHGVMSRLARVNNKRPVTYGGYTIPAGFPISMSQPLIHYNPDIFPKPEEFNPGRWLEGSEEDRKNLEKYLVPFSGGSRGCIGMNLAMAELHIALATVLRRFENLEIVKTSAEDILPWHDGFTPVPKTGQQNLFVTVV